MKGEKKMEKSKDKLSVFLSLVLRHKPEAAEIGRASCRERV